MLRQHDSRQLCSISSTRRRLPDSHTTPLRRCRVGVGISTLIAPETPTNSKQDLAITAYSKRPARMSIFRHYSDRPFRATDQCAGPRLVRRCTSDPGSNAVQWVPSGSASRYASTRSYAPRETLRHIETHDGTRPGLLSGLRSRRLTPANLGVTFSNNIC